MPGRHSKTVRTLTERDKKVFQFIFEQKVSSFEQIRDRFFPDTSDRTTRRRLYQLKNSGLLRHVPHTDGRRLRHLFRLSSKAYRHHVLERGVNDLVSQLASHSIDHDLTLTELRTRFERARTTVAFYPENVLQSSEKFSKLEDFRDYVLLRSDAVAEFVVKNKFRYVIPVEYEASIKSIERCEEKMMNYYIKSEAQSVFWICKNGSIQSRLENIERSFGDKFKPKMYFALQEKVLSDSDSFTLTSIQGKQITIR